MRIAFRVDASVKIGLGHIMRCLTLADVLTQHGHQCIFIFRDHPGHLGELIANKNFEFYLLPRAGIAAPIDAAGNSYVDWLGVCWEEDARQVVEVLSGLHVDWLIVDHYALDARWEREVSSVVAGVMVIDDLADREHQCDLLLDQNLGRQESDYDQLVPSDCIRLIGPQYALLRPEFAQLRERSLLRRQASEIKRMLISLGGVDRSNVTGQVLTSLLEAALPPSLEIDVVMGASSPHLDSIQRQVAQLPFRATVSVNVSDMAYRMCMADLSIGAAGGTSWERCCLGVPTVLVILADNQVAGARALEQVGAAAVIEALGDVQVKLPTLMRQLSDPSAIQKMSRCAAAVTMGDGADRVAQVLLEAVERRHDKA
jgi:UDP-2,4-diacetamido-2,4,6-trideoxy-beta-L-altropyranose hydrolase